MNTTTTMATGKRKDRFAPALFKGVLCTVLIGAGLLLLASFIAFCIPDPATAVRPCGYLALALCAFCGGTVTARFTRGAFLSGILCGSILAVLLFILSLCLRIESVFAFPYPLFFFAAVILLSGLGGLVGKHRRPRRKRLR